MPSLKPELNRRGDHGFSAVEALVAVVVLTLLFVFAITMFQNSNKMARTASLQGNSQQSGRVAIDLMTKDMRSIGYGVDLGAGQQGLVYAGPWDVIFNANITPGNDNSMAPAQPAAIDLTLAPAAVPLGAPLYAPAVTFATGAETVRYTLDSNGDGVVDATDQGDDAEEASPNPNDFVLRKEIYGRRGDGTNGGNGEPVAIVRGPVADQTGNLPEPLLTYWLDNDDDIATPEVLYGDANADGQLSQAEIAALTPIPAAQLALVTRAVITVSVEDSESQGRPDYRTRELVSSVGLRNLQRRSAIITGVVFQDADQDAQYDIPDESGINNVLVRLSSGPATHTSPSGQYAFEVEPGVYTVSEVDPAGYTSTTPNAVSVSAQTGVTHQVDFGDRPGMGVAEIEGTVYHDLNQNMIFNGGEPGIENVVVTLHTGQADTTDASGHYYFQVPVGTYTVVETDSTGWGSTTENVVEVVLSIDGQHEIVNFGDFPAGAQGIIHGLVYLDSNHDGIHDPSENGIADVPITVVGTDSTVTDGAGSFQFTVPVGLHAVREYDLTGYSSSTPNLITNLLVLPDSTLYVEFGDISNSNVNFTVVSVGSTNRALAITSTDLLEDNKGDKDIILGTQNVSGPNNLHVWHNQRKNSGTAITALFLPTPSFSRAAGGPIPALLKYDANNDAALDLVTGLEVTNAANLKSWITITSGADVGTYPFTPNHSFQTTAGTQAFSLAEVTWPGQSKPAVLVGTQRSAGAGTIEVWVESGAGDMTHLNSSDLASDSAGLFGEVNGIAVADFNQDGYPDLAIGQDRGSNQGKLSIFFGDPTQPWVWQESAVMIPEGAVHALSAVDMKEDASYDVDLVLGTSKLAGAGVVELWLNEGGLFGDPTGVPGQRARSDYVDGGGEVLSLGLARLDPDVFPDVVAGVRTTAYAGALQVYRTFGYLPSSGSTWSYPGSGEVVALTVDDYNIDGRYDIAVGTRTAVNTGQLVIYFGQ